MIMDISLLCLTLIFFIFATIFGIAGIMYLDIHLFIIAGLFAVAGFLLRLQHLEIGTSFAFK